MLFQDPETSTSLAATLSTLEWIDMTALAVMIVFFVLGIFKGFIWQASRIATLIAAYFVAGAYGADVGHWLVEAFGDPESGIEGQQTWLYVAYFLIFLAVLILLSLLAVLLQRLVRQAGLSFYDRLGGGLLGIGTGAVLMLAVLAGVTMFLPEGTAPVAAAERSHTLAYGRRAIELLGDTVPEPLRRVFGIEEETPQGNGVEQGR